jgi:hypothetical protein
MQVQMNALLAFPEQAFFAPFVLESFSFHLNRGCQLKIERQRNIRVQKESSGRKPITSAVVESSKAVQNTFLPARGR